MEISIIDIGSNSIRYMTAQSHDGKIDFSKKMVSTTRLAENQGADFILQKTPIERSLLALSEMAELSKRQNLNCYAYATSAVREAKNRESFLKLVKDLTGIDVRVLSGDEEAIYAYQAACPSGGAMIDIGGGSFQLISENKHLSFPLGCVRIHDMTGTQTLHNLESFALPYIDSITGFDNIEKWTSVGGTATKLAALDLHLNEYDPKCVSSHTFTQQSLYSLLCYLDELGEENRAKIPLLKKRYDTILGGGYLLYRIMQKFKIQTLSISDIDGMEGYAMYILNTLN